MAGVVGACVLALGSPAWADGPTPAAGSDAHDVDTVVASAMKAFAVPGMAVGIVKDGQLVLARGYGVRSIDARAPVDGRTLFQIGSNTKAFTTAAIAILVDEGKLKWDDKVVQYLPQFQLYDPYVTREFTIRDLVTHRSGLPSGAGDLLIFPDTDFTRAQMVERLRGLRPTTGFRARFGYDNVLYVAAGQVIEKASGEPWEAFVQRRILDRLGMQPCSTSSAGAKSVTNTATPHVLVGDHLVTAKPVDITTAGAAGSIHCNVEGMARWVEVQLSRGAVNGQPPLFSTAEADEMWSAQTPGPVPPSATEMNRTHLRAYGLGWNLEDFEGYKRVFHSGGVLGEVSHVTLIPELGLGIIVLANQQSSEAVNAVTLHIAKSYIGRGQHDWVQIYKSRVDAERAQARTAEAALAADIAKAGKPPLPLSAYAGIYRDPWRGDVTVAVRGNGLVISFSRTKRLSGSLQYAGNGHFIARWADRTLNADAMASFQTGTGGEVEGMSLASLPTTSGDLDFQDLALRKITNGDAGQ